ncbi:MAG: cytochrome c family protein [Planctomycetes bacterium]|nr:cytochrome c family protein [Planctomycetota bacterium]
MKLRAAHVVPLVFACASLVATLAQCGDGKAATPPAGPPPSRPAAPQDPKIEPPPKDALRLLVSGAMSGRLEPCGCASGQLGGLARRMQHIGEMRNYDLLLEGGNLVETHTELDVLKLFTAKTVLFNMEHPYDALGVGSNDLMLPAAEYAAFLGDVPLVATNLQHTVEGWPGKAFVEKDVRGTKVRIASFLLELPKELTGDKPPVSLRAVAEAWQDARAGADANTRFVVMAHGNDAQIRAFVPQLQPAPDLVVGVDQGYIEPTAAPTPVAGVPLVFAGIRGRVLLSLSLWRDATGPRAVGELVPLPGSRTVPGGGGDPNVRTEILRHRDEVKANEVLGRMARQLPTPNGAAYVGNIGCKGCHPTAYAAWEKSKHFHAWETLEKAEKDATRYGWPVTAYPDCVGCHVVGWREQTGFLSHADTPNLAGVGCERCHGPGSDHVMAPEKNKLGLHGGVAASKLCIQCHDFEQSPTFLYGERWPLIEHGREPNQGKK